MDGIDTHATTAAPPLQRDARFPVVLLSPGYGQPRIFYTALAAELASFGYLVAVLDHPGDAAVVEFPDGSVVYGNPTDDPFALLPVRVADARPRSTSSGASTPTRALPCTTASISGGWPS